MNRMKVGLVVLMAALFFGGTTVALAHGHGDEGCGGRGRGHHSPFARMMHRLNLTEAQKHDVAGILKKHEAEAKSVAKDMVQARKQLIGAIGSETSTDEAVRQAAQQVASQEEKTALIRAKIVKEVMGILTPAQKTSVQEMKTKMEGRLDSFVDAKFERMDKWIARHSK